MCRYNTIVLKVHRKSVSPLITWVEGQEVEVSAFYLTSNDLFGRKRYLDVDKNIRKDFRRAFFNFDLLYKTVIEIKNIF